MVDPSRYLPKAKKNWVCRCNILILMERDKTLLLRHCEKCKNKFTKLRERALGVLQYVCYFLGSTDSVQKVD